MFISRECDYAIRIMRELSDGQRKTVSDICKKEHVPSPYGYKILKKLENACLVSSRRGASGGYVIRRAPSEITICDILLAIDNEIFINACLEEGFVCPMNEGDRHCGVHVELCRVQNEILALLREKSLAEIL